MNHHHLRRRCWPLWPVRELELELEQGLELVQIVNADEFAPLTAAPPQTETPEAPETLRKSPS